MLLNSNLRYVINPNFVKQNKIRVVYKQNNQPIRGITYSQIKITYQTLILSNKIKFELRSQTKQLTKRLEESQVRRSISHIKP